MWFNLRWYAGWMFFLTWYKLLIFNVDAHYLWVSFVNVVYLSLYICTPGYCVVCGTIDDRWVHQYSQSALVSFQHATIIVDVIIWLCTLSPAGLDVVKEHILEMACIITDEDLNIVAEVHNELSSSTSTEVMVEGRKWRCIHVDQHVDWWDSWKHVW